MMGIDPTLHIIRIAPVHQVGRLRLNDLPKEKEFCLLPLAVLLRDDQIGNPIEFSILELVT